MSMRRPIIGATTYIRIAMATVPVNRRQLLLIGRAARLVSQACEREPSAGFEAKTLDGLGA
jgi:hypothetical protein